MRKWLVLLALVLGLAAFPARAQEAVRIASLRVDIWPEFDRPAVLVIYHITLAADTALPATLNLHVPAQALVNAVAIVDPSLGLLNAEYNRTVVGAWAVLSITTTSLEVQVEYYDSLVRNGTIRTIVYKWQGDAAVDAFNVAFQVPAGASNTSLDPAPASSQSDAYDLLNYVTDTLSLEAGETFTLTAQYEKADDELSVASMPVEPAMSLEETSGQTAWSDVLPWILGGLGLVLLILGMFVLFSFFGRSGWRRAKTRRQRKERHAPRASKAEEGESAQVHCHECGRRAQPGDQFCRSCGTRLRREE
ncbi:MAG: zinc ribbon domain-containing protein [Chloroflexota bacterium]